MSQETSRSATELRHRRSESSPLESHGYEPRPNAMVRLRRWGLALADAIALAIGIAVASAFDKVNEPNVGWIILAIPTWVLVAKLYNLYDRDHRRITHSTSDEIPALISTAAVTVVLVKLISEISHPGILPTAALFIAGTTSVILVIVLRSGVRRLYRRLARRERTIIIGSGSKAELAARRLRQKAADQIELVGYVSTGAKGDSGFGESLRRLGLDDLGDLSELDELGLAVGENRVSRVVIADDSISAKQAGRIIDVCRRAQASVTMVPANPEVLGPDTELNRIADVPMLDFHFSVPPRSTMIIKRAIDIIVAGVALVLAAPFLLVSAAFIKLDSPGPVFFRQIRVGKDGHKFNMFKLRTMVVDAEEQLDDLIDLNALEEPVFKIKDDPRITRVGSFLRRTSLDEVPQFINVLRGEMSMVGPRPEEEAVVALYDERQRERLSVKPGLTGPMQVAGRAELSFEERLAMERDYLDNLTITGDISIMIRTPRAVIKGNGAF